MLSWPVNKGFNDFKKNNFSDDVFLSLSLSLSLKKCKQTATAVVAKWIL